MTGSRNTRRLSKTGHTKVSSCLRGKEQVHGRRVRHHSIPIPVTVLLTGHLSFIKLMQESAECLTFLELPAPTKELQEAVIKAAKEHNLLTFAHATNLRETLLVLDAGVDGLAHQFFDQKHTKQLIESYKKTNAFVIPTLTAISSMMGLETAKDWAQSPRPGKLLTPGSRHSLCDCMKISREGCSVQFAYDCIKALKANGIDIIW